MRVQKTLPGTRLLQYDVINPDGQDLGQVENFIIDMSQGRIAFLVVSFGGILGLTDKWFALPWEILTWSPDDKKFILDMPREVLEQAPGLSKERWPEDIELSWLRECYTHYGCVPQWETPLVTEENTRKLAYSIWEAEGQPEGKDLEHYFRAEWMLREQEAKRSARQVFAPVLAVQSQGAWRR
ncbi:MAG: PRC-barrel domain-containing protein [Chloroflexi bacterium]|nr:PRC-barrel domain-containing protein [Chloroflexota bacterium]